MPTRFSIIITFYNQRGFIKDALDSALSQRNAEFEVIVVDDCSSDGSQEILKGYGDAIRLVCHETNKGVGAARNSGAALATGNYLLFHDGDDLFHRRCSRQIFPTKYVSSNIRTTCEETVRLAKLFAKWLIARHLRV